MRRDHGFSLIEALIATAVLLLLFSAAMPALNQTMMFNRTVGDLSEMHGSVRGATELMQQEIGQAGRVALPGPISLAAAAPKGSTTVALSTTTGLFVGAQITVGAGDQMETVTLTAVASPNVTAVFGINHAAAEPVQLLGGFVTGVIPPGMANGSTGTKLKLYGDINDDGNMVYVEYTCDTTTNKKLYRNVMAWNAASKPAVTESMALLNNVVPNPSSAPCFTYETQTVLANTYVTGVAVTLSVESQQIDLYSKVKNQATKTLLNVAPRNIFLAWSMASIGITSRLQPTPPTILLLLP